MTRHSICIQCCENGDYRSSFLAGDMECISDVCRDCMKSICTACMTPRQLTHFNYFIDNDLCMSEHTLCCRSCRKIRKMVSQIVGLCRVKKIPLPEGISIPSIYPRRLITYLVEEMLDYPGPYDEDRDEDTLHEIRNNLPDYDLSEPDDGLDNSVLFGPVVRPCLNIPEGESRRACRGCVDDDGYVELPLNGHYCEDCGMGICSDCSEKDIVLISAKCSACQYINKLITVYKSLL